VLCRTCRFALVAGPADGVPDDVEVATSFTGRVRDILLGFKYGNRRGVANHLGGLLARRLGDGPPIDLVTWAPTGPRRRRQRGFDQAELLARSVAAHLGVDCRRVLDRRGGPEAQTGQRRAARLDPRRRPRFIAHPGVAGRQILVIDDVVTTGATLHAAEAALHHVGVASVRLAAFAATPTCLPPAAQVA